MKKDEGFRTRPPYQLLFNIAAIIETFCIVYPIRLFQYTFNPASRPHPQWSLLRSVFISLLNHYRHRTHPYNIISGAVDKSVMPRPFLKLDATPLWIQPIDPKTELHGDLKQLFEAGSCTVLRRNIVWWYGRDHAGKKDRRAQEGEKVILYLHGGGYRERGACPVDPTINCLRIILSASAKSAKKMAPKRGLAVEYRLSHETSFPGILADALSSWKYLIDQGFKPKDIIISGDSAGGNLTLALTRYLIQHRPFYTPWKKDDEVADGIILFSPWIDITLSYCSSTSYRNLRTDYLHPDLLGRAAESLVDGLPKDASTNSLLSSLCKERKVSKDDFDGFPRALLFGASLEVLIDEIRDLNHYYDIAAKAERCKPITFFEEPLATHDWCALPIGFSEEQKRTLKQVNQWI